jgi:hypothetical protein
MSKILDAVIPPCEEMPSMMQWPFRMLNMSAGYHKTEPYNDAAAKNTG